MFIAVCGETKEIFMYTYALIVTFLSSFFSFNSEFIKVQNVLNPENWSLQLWSEPDLLAHLVGVGQQPACSPAAHIRSPPLASLNSGSNIHTSPRWRAPASFLHHMDYGVWRWWELDANCSLSSWVPVGPCSSLLHTWLFFLIASPDDLQWLQTHHQRQKHQLSIEFFTSSSL